MASSPPELRKISYFSEATRQERNYFLYLPEGYFSSSLRTWPLLLVLHGDGERGDGQRDLDYLLRNGPLYEAWIQKRSLPFVIIAPQLPLYGRESFVPYLKHRLRDEIPERLEVGVPKRPIPFLTPPLMTGSLAAELPQDEPIDGPPDGWSKLEADVQLILNDVKLNYRTDPTRWYLTGISYGGFGAWYFASRYPEQFAAVVPVVGYGHPDLMGPIAKAHLPIWCFAGGADEAVPVKYFYPGLNRLKALNHSVRFTIEEDMSHDVWTRVYEGDDVYNWLLSHTKPKPPSP
jgi:predicted peptidase